MIQSFGCKTTTQAKKLPCFVSQLVCDLGNIDSDQY